MIFLSGARQDDTMGPEDPAGMERSNLFRGFRVWRRGVSPLATSGFRPFFQLSLGRVPIPLNSGGHKKRRPFFRMATGHLRFTLRRRGTFMNDCSLAVWLGHAVD